MNCRDPLPTVCVKMLLVSCILSVSQLNVSAADPSSAKHHPQHAKLDAFGLPVLLLEGLLRSKDPRQARIVLGQTPRHENDDDARTSWLAACLAVEGKDDESVAEFRKIKNIGNVTGYVLSLEAAAYAQTQDFGKAKELSSLAIKRDKYYQCYELRAAFYSAEKRYVEAADDYEKAVIYNNHRAGDLYCKAAQSMLNANQPAKALALVNKASSLKKPHENGSLNVPLLTIKADCLEKLNRYTEAIALFTTCMAVPHSNIRSGSRFLYATCLTERAKCYEKLGRKAEAAADRKALDNMSSGLANDLLGK